MDRIDLEQRLYVNILQSEYAYRLYLKDRRYYSAKRIYLSNLEILDSLNEYKYIVDRESVDAVINYIFHLQDWILQFNETEKVLVGIEDIFAFQKLVNHIPFPKSFVNNVLKK